MHAARSFALTICLSGLWAEPGSAQEQPGQLVVGAIRTPGFFPGGIWVLDSTGSKWSSSLVRGTSSLFQNPASLAADPAEPELFYAGTFGRSASGKRGVCHVKLLHMLQGGLVSEVQLNKEPLDEDYVVAVVPLGDYVYYLGRSSLGRVSRAGGTPETLIRMLAGWDPRGMTTDGRHLFAIVSKFDIVRLDPFDRKTSLFARRPANSVDQLRNLGVDPKGHVLAVTTSLVGVSHLLRFHGRTGKVMNQLKLPLAGARAVAADSANGDIYVSGATSETTSGVYRVRNWQVDKRLWDNVPHALPALIVRRPRPVFYHGIGCADANGRTPKLHTNSHPHGNDPGFRVELRDAGPSQPAALWFGRHNLQNHAALPIDLGSIGAPGCMSDLSSFFVFMGKTNEVGRLALPLPLPGVDRDADNRARFQWLVLAPKANNLQVVTSASATLWVRNR